MLKSVAVIVVPNFSIFEFATACEVFGIDRSERGSNVLAFDFRVCTPQPGDVRMKSGLSMNVSLGLDATADADLVIMTPFGRNEDVPESVLEALRAADARGAWVMSICSGAFALASAGLLNGRRCTTHWHYSHELAQAGTRKCRSMKTCSMYRTAT
ncbi:UNVERIFIED_ORG: transcriptional regulator GlxA family with amidase domain [Arthrobacter sp. UYEF2]